MPERREAHTSGQCLGYREQCGCPRQIFELTSVPGEFLKLFDYSTDVADVVI